MDVKLLFISNLHNVFLNGKQVLYVNDFLSCNLAIFLTPPIQKDNIIHGFTIDKATKYEFNNDHEHDILINEKYGLRFDKNSEAEIDHISLSRWADLILIAPATANTISKISYGLSDDLASTVVFASDKKIFIAPAMNVRMWEH